MGGAYLVPPIDLLTARALCHLVMGSSLHLQYLCLLRHTKYILYALLKIYLDERFLCRMLSDTGTVKEMQLLISSSSSQPSGMEVPED